MLAEEGEGRVEGGVRWNHFVRPSVRFPVIVSRRFSLNRWTVCNQTW